MEKLEKKCPRCGKPSKNSGNSAGRCSACLGKLKTARHTPGTYQRAQQKADSALRRQDGTGSNGVGETTHKSKGRGTRKEIVDKIQRAEKKTGQKLSPDRIDNAKGYASSNVRSIPESLNVGRHKANPKKLKNWMQSVKKSDLTDEQVKTLILSKAEEANPKLVPIIKALKDSFWKELVKK